MMRLDSSIRTSAVRTTVLSSAISTRTCGIISLAGLTAPSINLRDHSTDFFQGAFGFKGEGCKIERLQLGKLRGKANKGRVFGEIGLASFGVSIADAMEATTAHH